MLVAQRKCSEFLPVNDEYRPFPVVERRNFFQANLEIPLLVKAMKLPKRSRILEIGCGTGVALAEFVRLCEPSRLAGIDIDHDLLKRAKKRLEDSGLQAELYQEDTRKLHFANESFDVIIDFGTCYHINRRVMALREIGRVLSSGGIFVYETPLNQFLSHPVRSLGQRIPWEMMPDLKPGRSALFWASRVKKGVQV